MSGKIKSKTADSTGEINLLSYAFLAFAGFALEIALLLAEGLFYGYRIDEWSVAVNIGHWTLTCLLWGGYGYAIIRHLKKKGIDLTGKRAKLSGKDVLITVLCILFAGAFSFIGWGFRCKPAVELAYLGFLKFCFQYLYYLGECLLIVLTITLSQSFYDERAKGRYAAYVPFGGLFLGLTWGLMHTFTQGSLLTGIECMISGVIYGAAFLAVKKDWRFACPVIALMFMF